MSHEQTSDSEVPQKTKRRRHQSYSGTTSYRSFRRKAKTPLSSASNTSTRVADKSDSSSDYDDEDLIEFRNANMTVSSSAASAPAPPLLNIPSTSTGITANGYSFRIANTTYDSEDDDDDDDQSSIPATNHQVDSNILSRIRSPLNNNINHVNNNFNNNRHHQEYEINEGASTSSQFRNNSIAIRNHYPLHNNNHQNHENGRRKYRHQDDEHEDYASTNNSNSLLSSSSEESSTNDDDDNHEKYPSYFNKKRRLSNYLSVKINHEASTSTNATNDKKETNSINKLSNAIDVMKKTDANKRNYKKNMQTSDDSD